MDPIKRGTEIFKTLASKFEKEETRDINVLQHFFNELLKATRGLVILDFLDTASWDSVKGFNIDNKQNHLYLYWHDYRNVKESDEEKMVRQMAFPADLKGLFMHFQSLKIVKMKKFSLFFLRGYALSDKEIKKYLAKDTQEFKILKDMNNFSKTVIRRINNKLEIYTCLHTPIYSLLILPKNAVGASNNSKQILYDCNLYECMDRLKKTLHAISELKESDFDKICEKSNTVRRVLENVFKIECCYREVPVKKSYSQLRLGDLIALIKRYKDDTEKLLLNKVAQWSNELSHDSGIPIEKNKAELLCLLSLIYTELLRTTIKLYPWPDFS